MLFGAVGIHQESIQVDDYRDVNHVGKDIIHEPLETSWGVGEPLGHHQPLKGPISGPESGFSFVTIGDTDEMVGMSQVDFGVDSHLLWVVLGKFGPRPIGTQFRPDQTQRSRSRSGIFPKIPDRLVSGLGIPILPKTISDPVWTRTT